MRNVCLRLSANRAFKIHHMRTERVGVPSVPASLAVGYFLPGSDVTRRCVDCERRCIKVGAASDFSLGGENEELYARPRDCAKLVNSPGGVEKLEPI